MIDPKVTEFWQIAQTFPPNKEEVYPEHAMAQQFDTEHVRGKTVLEYGCGGGSDTISYLKRGCRVLFADVVHSNVIATSERVRAFGNEQRAQAPATSRDVDAGLIDLRAKRSFLQASDDLGRITDETFDVVSAHGVLHHIEDLSLLDRVLIEFRRVLKPTGRLYVMLYTRVLYDRYAEQVQELRAKDPSIHSWQEALGHFTDGPGCPWATYYDVEEGYELFRRNGFEVSSTFVYNNGDFRTFRCVKPS